MISMISQEVAMVDLLVRDLSEELTRDINARADKAGRSVSDEVKAILQQEVSRSAETPRFEEISGWESLRSIMVAASEEEAAEYVKIMEEIEAERKRDLGRRAEDLG
jgi:plasmid stability protein